jgi:hypothetical protein
VSSILLTYMELFWYIIIAVVWFYECFLALDSDGA